MAKKINIVPAEDLKKGPTLPPIEEPTIESRVKGLEYRAAHPNKPKLQDLLQDPDNGIAFRKELKHAIEEMGVGKLPENLVYWDETPHLAESGGLMVELFGRANGLGRTALVPEIAHESERFHVGPFIWSTLIGAALALAVLSLVNPMAFKRPQPAVFVATQRGDVAIPAVEPSALPAITTDHSHATHPIEPKLQAPSPLVTITLDKECWVKVGNAEGFTYAAHTMALTSMRIPPGTEVRSGCPGAIHYQVDGEYINPTNFSKKPSESEVVNLYP